MKSGKFIVAAMVMPTLVAPSVAAPVRPAVKAVSAAPAKQGRSLAVRTGRAGAETGKASSLAGLPILALISGLVAAAAVVAVAASDPPASPGS